MSTDMAEDRKKLACHDSSWHTTKCTGGKVINVCHTFNDLNEDESIE